MTTTSSASAAVSTSHLRLAIARTARRLRQEAGTDLSPSLSAALNSVERHGPLTPSELADRERVTRPTATRVLARLEEAALIARIADVSDRRSSLVSVTPAGKALLRTSRTRKDAWLDRRLHTLSPAERATLAEAAAILERMLEDER